MLRWPSAYTYAIYMSISGPNGSLSTVAPLQAIAQAIKPGGSSSLGGKEHEMPRSMQALLPSVRAGIGKYACNCRRSPTAAAQIPRYA